jgi:hypothetical protein
MTVSCGVEWLASEITGLGSTGAGYFTLECYLSLGTNVD